MAFIELVCECGIFKTIYYTKKLWLLQFEMNVTHMMPGIAARKEKSTPSNSCLSASQPQSIPGRVMMVGLFWSQVYQPVCQAYFTIWVRNIKEVTIEHSQRLYVCVIGHAEVMWANSTITHCEYPKLNMSNPKCNLDLTMIAGRMQEGTDIPLFI